MLSKKKILSLGLVFLLVSVGTLVDPLNVSACKPVKPVAVEKKIAIINTVVNSDEFVKLIENQKLPLNLENATVTATKDRTNIVFIPLENTGYKGFSFLVYIVKNDKIQKTAVVEKEQITDGFLYKITVKNKIYYFSVSNNGRIAGLPFTAGFEDCMAECLGLWCAQDPWGCWACIGTCISCFAPPHLTCIPCAICAGSAGIGCIIQCLFWG